MVILLSSHLCTCLLLYLTTILVTSHYYLSALVGGLQSALCEYDKRAHRKWQMIVTMYNNENTVEVVGSNGTW